MSKPKPSALVAAIAAGDTMYFTGKPCPSGHIADRYVSGNSCVECTRRRHQELTAKHGLAWRKQISARSYASHKKWLMSLDRAGRTAFNRRKKGRPDPTRPEPILCEACNKPCTMTKGYLSLDHCHDTGLFRGWLCNKCNRGLGVIGDRLENVMYLAVYLHRFKAAQQAAKSGPSTPSVAPNAPTIPSHVLELLGAWIVNARTRSDVSV